MYLDDPSLLKLKTLDRPILSNQSAFYTDTYNQSVIYFARERVKLHSAHVCGRYGRTLCVSFTGPVREGITFWSDVDGKATRVQENADGKTFKVHLRDFIEKPITLHIKNCTDAQFPYGHCSVIAPVSITPSIQLELLSTTAWTNGSLTLEFNQPVIGMDVKVYHVSRICPVSFSRTFQTWNNNGTVLIRLRSCSEAINSKSSASSLWMIDCGKARLLPKDTLRVLVSASMPLYPDETYSFTNWLNVDKGITLFEL